MRQVLHGNATMTEADRREINNCQESLGAEGGGPHHCHPGIVLNWKKRSMVIDFPTGPRKPKVFDAVTGGTSDCGRLSAAYTIAAGRVPLCASATIPHLTQSSSHRCLHRHGVCRLLDFDGDRIATKG